MKSVVLVTQGQQQYMKMLTQTAYRRGYSPYINDDGFWVVYDDDSQAYVITDILSRGVKGDQGDKGENGDNYVITEDDYDEIAALVVQHTFDVEKDTLQMSASVSGDTLSIRFGTQDSPYMGAVEVVTDVTVT